MKCSPQHRRHRPQRVQLDPQHQRMHPRRARRAGNGPHNRLHYGGRNPSPGTEVEGESEPLFEDGEPQYEVQSHEEAAEQDCGLAGGNVYVSSDGEVGYVIVHDLEDGGEGHRSPEPAASSTFTPRCAVLILSSLCWHLQVGISPRLGQRHQRTRVISGPHRRAASP